MSLFLLKALHLFPLNPRVEEAFPNILNVSNHQSGSAKFVRIDITQVRKKTVKKLFKVKVKVRGGVKFCTYSKHSL